MSTEQDELTYNDKLLLDADAMNIKISDEDKLVLTTIDNPYNPHTQYAQWKLWDESNEYNTESYLARIANELIDLNVDDDLAIASATNEAINSIIENDPLGVYILV